MWSNENRFKRQCSLVFEFTHWRLRCWFFSCLFFFFLVWFKFLVYVVAVNEFCCVDNNKYCNNGIWPSNHATTTKHQGKGRNIPNNNSKKNASINFVSLAQWGTCLCIFSMCLCMQIKHFFFILDPFCFAYVNALYTISA